MAEAKDAAAGGAEAKKSAPAAATAGKPAAKLGGEAPVAPSRGGGPGSGRRPWLGGGALRRTLSRAALVVVLDFAGGEAAAGVDGGVELLHVKI
jgi:hypothetical protein